MKFKRLLALEAIYLQNTIHPACSIHQRPRINTIAPRQSISTNPDQCWTKAVTIDDYSPLFAIIHTIRCSLFATIRYSGFPDTRFQAAGIALINKQPFQQQRNFSLWPCPQSQWIYSWIEAWHSQSNVWKSNSIASNQTQFLDWVQLNSAKNQKTVWDWFPNQSNTSKQNRTKSIRLHFSSHTQSNTI